MSIITQNAFAAGLLAGTQAPVGLVSWNAELPGRRYQIYRNNVTSSLTAALAATFPATRCITGPDFFLAMAQAFIRSNPPQSPVLLAYGDQFPDFVVGFEPANILAYLPDVMRLEAARRRAYHAADAMPLDPQVLARLKPAELDTLTFSPHPSLSILSSVHPVVTIWAMNAGVLPLGPIAHWHGEDALVLRPHMMVEVIPLSPGAAVFHSLLAGGANLGEAAEGAMEVEQDFNLPMNLTVLLRSGAYASVRKEPRHEDRCDI